MDLVDAPNGTAVTAIQAGLAVPGDAMTLTEIYDAAKTAAQAGDAMTLGEDGLDAIPITPPAGAAATFREMIVQTWRRFFKKATKSATQLKTYADDGETVLATQAVSDDGTTESQGAAE